MSQNTHPDTDKNCIFSEFFHQSPLNIAVIDRDHNIVDANENFRNYFGDWKDRKCFQVYKGTAAPCDPCQVMRSFEDGKVRIHEEMGVDANGKPAHYVVHTSPVVGAGGKVTHLIEMSQNVTDTLHQAREHQILFERAPCYISILDRDFNIVRANEKLRNTFGECRGDHCYHVFKDRDVKCDECPAEMSFNDGKEHSSTHMGYDQFGKETHYMVTATPLSRGPKGVSHVMEILTDITQLKHLEKEMLEAERLSAVGQTVAGLAHTVKNILMGIEGGMYMVGTGIKNDNRDRLNEGWGMLHRNIEKVTILVKDFLSFAKGRVPEVAIVEPADLVDDIISLYGETARSSGVLLTRSSGPEVRPAVLDREGIHTCLTNLMSNAIDACLISGKDGLEVKIGVRDENGVLSFEVSDNGCGIEYDVKQKVFTTFFTTKGGKGTGLGLLTTKKIIQEHGGRIEVESEPGKGSLFKIVLPRHRLPGNSNGKGVSDG